MRVAANAAPRTGIRPRSPAARRRRESCVVVRSRTSTTCGNSNLVASGRRVGRWWFRLQLAFVLSVNPLECSALSAAIPLSDRRTSGGRRCCLCLSAQQSADELAYQRNQNSQQQEAESDEDTGSFLASALTPKSTSNIVPRLPTASSRTKHIDLMWCDANVCKDDLRERIIGEQIVMRGPATGQVAYHWSDDDVDYRNINSDNDVVHQSVLFLVKQSSDMDALLAIAADAVQRLMQAHANLRILLDPSTAARLKHYHGVDGRDQIHLFEARDCPGFGENVSLEDVTATEFGNVEYGTASTAAIRSVPNLIVTLGGDGLLMHAGMLFQGPMPPILCVSGGSLGFLTPFKPTEMVEAVELALDLVGGVPETPAPETPKRKESALQVFPPNMPTYPYDDEDNGDSAKEKFSFRRGDVICLSIRMRLDCRIINREGAIKARYNVLNEVVVDRGSSPYLAALECFCDDAHLTTVQADGVIFATPTGSTAYSLAAGSSVVHPAVPCILVTPICPHVLSFRPMVFPDHVILRCYVPDDARAEASVAFDGKHRQELRRGDSVQIQMSAYPVPTINRKDHSADWLGSLKRNFNFNSRPRQRPL